MRELVPEERRVACKKVTMHSEEIVINLLTGYRQQPTRYTWSDSREI